MSVIQLVTKSRDQRPQGCDSEKVLKIISKGLYSIIANNIDTEKYTYSVSIWQKKIKTGDLVVNLKVNKSNTESIGNLSSTIKYLSFVINRNEKTGLIHINVLDVDNNSTKIVFSSSDKYPLTKAERYIIRILKSVEETLDNEK